MLVLGFIVAAWTPAWAAWDPQTPGPAVLSADHPVGQTFFSRHAGLDGLDISFVSPPAGQGELVLHLRSGPDTSTDLAVAHLPISSLAGPGYQRFSFPAQRDSYLRSYYLHLELDGTGSFSLGTGPADSSLDGSLYINEKPVEAQLLFLPHYDRWLKLSGLLLQGGAWLLQLTLAALVFLLPGLALLLFLKKGGSLSLWEAVPIAGGISLALYPVLFLWLDLVGLRPGAIVPWAAVGLSSLSLAYFLFTTVRTRRSGPGQIPEKRNSQGWLARQLSSPGFYPGLALFFVVALVLFARLWVIRTVPAPLFGDSVQHAAMAQLIFDHGGLFTSWQPYAAFQGLTNQHGFSTNAAVWMWVSGQPVTQGVLFFGQLANFLAVLGLYPLAVRLTSGNRWAGVVAVAFAGIYSLLPGYYLNWGRYAQLAGQAILPASLWLTWEQLDHGKVRPAWLGLLGVLIAGMLLSYYRMAFYYAAFLLPLLLIWWLPRRQKNSYQGQAIISLAGIAVFAVVALLPWVFRVSGSTLASEVGEGISSGTPLQGVIVDYQAWSSALLYFPWAVIALCGLIWVVSLVRRQWLVSIPVLSAILLAGVRAGALLHLPGANKMQSFAVVIFLYFPAGLLIGWFFGGILSWLQSRSRQAGQAAALALVFGASILALPQQLNVLKPYSFSLVTWPDIRAMTWIDQNAPDDALFLVEGYTVYQNTAPVGTDAGWWLPLLGHRLNTMPPQYALMNEQPDQPGYLQRLIDLNGILSTNSPTSPAGLKALCRWGITHVYIGQVQGQTGANTRQLFSPQDFEQSSAFVSVYAQDRVNVYALQPGVCQ